MKRHARTAFRALEGIGAPVTNHCENGEDLEDQWGAHFILGAELRTGDDKLFADHYGEEIREHRDDETGRIVNAFGIRQDVIDILGRSNLHAEWIDPGTVGVYDA